MDKTVILEEMLELAEKLIDTNILGLRATLTEFGGSFNCVNKFVDDNYSFEKTNVYAISFAGMSTVHYEACLKKLKQYSKKN